MYSVRRLSTVPASPHPHLTLDTNHHSETSKVWGSTGSIPSSAIPIPLSASRITPLTGMTIGKSDLHEPHRDLVLNLYVVRHGETDLNQRRPRVVQGQMDVPLNSHGIKQALMVAHRLSNVKIDYIYSSDLTRARQTAEEIGRRMNKVVLIDSRLREQGLADLTGQLWSAAKSRLKQVDKTFENYLAVNQGETSEMVKERIVQSYIDVVEKHLLNPNRIELPRSGSGNILTEQYGPVTPISGLEPPANTPLATISQEAQKRNVKGRLSPRISNVVLVTHGGPIRQLINHLVVDLGFTYHPKVVPGSGKRNPPNVKPKNGLPVEPRMTQFPHTAGIFHVRLTRKYIHETSEYDWCGHIIKFNDSSHLAGISSWTLNQHKNVPTSSAQESKHMRLVTQHDIPIASNCLTRVPKKAGKAGDSPKKTSTVESPAARAKNMGMRVFGKLIGTGQTGSTITPKPEDKRNKSLGW